MKDTILMLAFVLCFTSIGQATVLFIQRKINRKYNCILWWLHGSVLQAFGYICLLFIHFDSFLFMSKLAFLLIVCGQLLFYRGILSFLNRKVKNLFFVLYLSIFLIIYGYYVFIVDNIVLRSGVVAIAIACILLFSAFRLFQDKNEMYKISARFGGSIYLIHAIYLIFYTVRIVEFSNSYSYELFSVSLIRLVAYIVPILSSMLSVYAFIIMVNQSLNAKNIILVQQLEVEKENLEIDAITDSLTGLMNRRFFDRILNTEFKRSKRSGSQLSLIMLDVDFFKNYNDSYGHIEGDRCLIKLSEALGMIVSRTADIVARYGGEEFFVILPETDQTGALVVANKIKKAISELKIPHNSSKVAKIVTVSMGVISVDANDFEKIEEIIKFADNALYKAKETGRNRVILSEESSEIQL